MAGWARRQCAKMGGNQVGPYVLLLLMFSFSRRRDYI
jgi:hypothetical protein